MRKESRYLFYVTLIFIGVIFGVLLTGQLNFHKTLQAENNYRLVNENFTLPEASNINSQVASRDDLSDKFIEINKKVTPSVVSIRAVRMFSNNEMRRFHKNQDEDFFERLNPFRNERGFQQGSSGSGIIVHKDGYILTNTHVVKGANKLDVTLNDSRQFHGKIVGVDSLTEVAVIKIEGDNLPVANLGDSEKLEVGQWVVAIGNPLELQFTITAGIISAIGRQMRIIGDRFGIENFIQTDAVINPGNSGGALVDLKGNVIGVNTAIATRSGYYEGYGFAIPINLAKAVMEDLVTKGRVVRAFLGIVMLQMDYKKAKAYGMEKVSGVYIDDLLDEGPAGKAGVKPEDIILAINGTEVNQSNQIQSFVAQQEPGEEVILSIYRNGDIIKIPVVLAERETGQVQTVSVPDEPEEPAGLGLSIKELSRRQARELGLNSTKGVLVTEVKTFGKAFDAGLRRGVVIIKVNDVEVNNENDFWDEIDKFSSGDVAKLLVRSGPAQTHMFIEIP